MPRLEAVSVHEPALGAGGVVADQLDGAGHIKDILTLSSSQTEKILQTSNMMSHKVLVVCNLTQPTALPLPPADD